MFRIPKPHIPVLNGYDLFRRNNEVIKTDFILVFIEMSIYLQRNQKRCQWYHGIIQFISSQWNETCWGWLWLSAWIFNDTFTCRYFLYSRDQLALPCIHQVCCEYWRKGRKYWLELHKRPYKVRSIANSSSIITIITALPSCYQTSCH